MFNKNYLGHSFINDCNETIKYNGDTLICENCGIRIFYYDLSDLDSAYTVRKINKNYNYFEILMKCDECIIKNIIE
jgi:hypothetical protein